MGYQTTQKRYVNVQAVRHMEFPALLTPPRHKDCLPSCAENKTYVCNLKQPTEFLPKDEESVTAEAGK